MTWRDCGRVIRLPSHVLILHAVRACSLALSNRTATLLSAVKQKQIQKTLNQQSENQTYESKTFGDSNSDPGWDCAGEFGRDGAVRGWGFDPGRAQTGQFREQLRSQPGELRVVRQHERRFV